MESISLPPIILLYQKDKRNLYSNIIQKERDYIHFQEIILFERLYKILEDIVYLSNLSTTKRLIDSNFSDERKKFTESILLSFLKRKEEYLTIRIIDKNGKEILKLKKSEEEFAVTPPENLQDKSQRYYTIKIKEMGNDYIYLSPIDYNIENNRIEYPVTPVIRFARKLLNRNNEYQGYIIINYRAQNIITAVEQLNMFTEGTTYFIDSNGLLLSSSNKKDGSKDYLLNGMTKQIGDIHPDFWTFIQSSKSDFFQTSDLFIYKDFSPHLIKKFIPENNGVDQKIASDKYSWKMISYINKDHLSGLNRNNIINLIISLLASIFLIAFFSFISAFLWVRNREEGHIFNMNPSPVIRINKNKEIVLINSSAKKFFDFVGFDKNQISLKTWINKNLGDTSKITNTKFEYTKNSITLLFTVIKETKSNNLLFYGLDISDLKRSENELYKLFTAIGQSANVVVMTDRDGKITYVNDAFEKSTGYSKIEAIGITPNILRSGHHPDKFYKELWTTILGGEVWNGTFLNKRKDGETYWEDATITPISDKNGEIAAFIALKEDITKKKEIEENLKKAKEHAVETSRIKSDFLANMSHEIRTPMNAILGFTDILLLKEDDPSKQKKLGLIKRAGVELLDLINDILDLSKIEANRILIDKIPFSPLAMLNQLGELYSILAEKKSIDFNINITQDIPDFLIGDPKRIRQIINNLLGNALKFTKKGYVKLESFYSEGKLSILIKDSGIGIPKKLQGKIFNAFQQGDSSSRREFQGTGLGLAISKKFIDMMDGSIIIDSSKGVGSLFTIVIPLAVSHENKVYELEEISSYEDETVSNNHPGYIMVQNWINSCNGNQKMINILLKAITGLPKKVEILGKAIGENKADDIDFITHDLKGICGNFTMTELYNPVKSINMEIKNDKPDYSFILESYKNLDFFVSNIPSKYKDTRITFQKSESGNSDYPQILTVDDNELNRELIITFLQEINIGTDVAGGGKEALKKMRTKKYDILLLDMNMPEMSGEEVIQEMGKNDDFSDLYVVAVTANAMKGDAQKYIEIGCNYYLSKPVDHEKLNNTILNLIATHTVKSNNSEKTDSYSLSVLTKKEFESVEKLINRLKINLDIFDPDQILTIASELNKISGANIIEKMTSDLKSIAEEIDEEELENFFKKIIYPE